MFYEVQAKAHIRVPPALLKLSTKDAVLQQLTESFEGYISQEIGFVVAIMQVENVGQGVIIPGDGAAYFDTEFKMITFVPEMQELVVGKISDITNFGAFLSLGVTDGMIHVSQTMDDFISFNKQKTLSGKESKKVLKVGDKCRARIIAISFKDLANPKVGLTMRQPQLGALRWVEEEAVKREKPVKTKKEKS